MSGFVAGITKQAGVGVVVLATKNLLQNVVKDPSHNRYLRKKFHVNNQGGLALIALEIVPVYNDPSVFFG